MGEEELFWVSQHNRSAEVLGETYFPRRLKFYDTTLRDGEQTVGIGFDKGEKLQIAKMVDALGVERIESGMPVVSKEEKEAVELILNASLKAEIWGFCKADKSDIDACIDVGLKFIVCEIATSPQKIEANKFTPEIVLSKILDSLQYAKGRGLYTAFFAVDATRADVTFLETICKKAVEEGAANEVVLVDTVGVATPETMFYLTRKLKEWVNVPIMAHCHNDFGVATACTLASVKAGAEYVHVTLNGLGGKAGNADMSETAIGAKLYGIPHRIDVKKLYQSAKLAEKLSRIPLSPLKPIVGENIFKREREVAVAQLIASPPSAEAYSPELVGREREILLGKKSGKKSVEYKLQQLGLSATPDQVNDIVTKVKEMGKMKKAPVSDDEFRGITERIVMS